MVYNSINLYVELMQKGRLSGIVGYNTELYAQEIAKSIKTVYSCLLNQTLNF